MTEQTELMIDLSGIVKSEGMELAISKEYPKEAFLEFDKTLSLETPVTLTGTITNHAGNLFLDGTLSFTAKLNCDRCLEPFFKQFTIPMEDTIAREDSGLEADEFIPYQHNSVLLTEAIYKCIFAVTLDQQLCKSDCKGLCSVCGCNRNETDCNCDDTEIDPRLLKLKELFQ